METLRSRECMTYRLIEWVMGKVCTFFTDFFILSHAFLSEQGKKVCKAPAVRCANLLLFAGIAEKRYSEMVTTTATLVSC